MIFDSVECQTFPLENVRERVMGTTVSTVKSHEKSLLGLHLSEGRGFRLRSMQFSCLVLGSSRAPRACHLLDRPTGNDLLFSSSRIFGTVHTMPTECRCALAHYLKGDKELDRSLS